MSGNYKTTNDNTKYCPKYIFLSGLKMVPFVQSQLTIINLPNRNPYKMNTQSIFGYLVQYCIISFRRT